MKIRCLLWAGILFTCTCFGQTGLSSDDWRSDLRFLQETVHKDYSFLFKKVEARQFDSAVDKFYADIPSMKEYEIMGGFQRIISLFQYGHTNIHWMGSGIRYHVIPMNLYWFSDGIFVEGVRNTYSSVLGAKLVKVEGVPVEKALHALHPLSPAENEEFFRAYGIDYLLIPEALAAQKVVAVLKPSVTYTFEKNGKTFDLRIPSEPVFQLPRNYGYTRVGNDWLSVRDSTVIPYYLKHLDKIYYFEYLPRYKTVYVRQSQIQDDPDEDIPAFYKRVFSFIEANDVEKLVLDVRLNGGGNNYKNKPIVTGIIETKKINQPGKLFVIIGRRTFSACQNLVNELDNYTNALFVGEPTGENINFYGDNRRVELPKSKIPVSLSFAWWQDKPQWENAPWLAPQLAVETSFKQYESGEDPVLDACLNFSDKDPVLDPMAYLRDLFMAGKLEELESTAKKMIADPRYRYVNFEGKINRAGYDLIRIGNFDQAIWVMNLNTRLYPKSANTWDSLGEAYWRAKQNDKAIESYKKAIELDPNGQTGKNSRNMLERIQSGKEF